MTGLLRRFWILPITLIGFGLVPTTSRATLTIVSGNGSPTTTLQYLEAQGTTGTVFHAESNQLGTVIEVTVNTTGMIQGTGQAKIIPVSGGSNFMTASFSFVDPYAGTEAIEINPGFGGDFADGTEFTVFGYDQNNVEYSQDFVIQNGQNRFTIESDAIQYITGVTITTNPLSLINEIAQIRIGRTVLNGGPGPVVPEPSTFALAIGCIVPLAAIGLVRRRRQAKVQAA